MSNTFLSEDNNGEIIHLEDLGVHIIFCICSIVINFASFFVFYFRKSKNRSCIVKLMMLMCISESVCYYTIVMLLYEFPELVHNMKVRDFFSWLTFRPIEEDLYLSHYQTAKQFQNLEYDTSFPKLLTLMNVEYSLYTTFFTTSLVLNICYCIEVICMFANPISDWTKRFTLYLWSTFVLTIIAFVLDYNIFYDRELYTGEFRYNHITRSLWLDQYVNAGIMLLFIIVGFVSVVYVLKNVYNNSKFYSGQRIAFSIRHVLYIALYISLWMYPLIGMIQGSFKQLSVKVKFNQ